MGNGRFTGHWGYGAYYFLAGKPASSGERVKLEKPMLAVFAGNVPDYAILRSDFKYTIEVKCSNRDAIIPLLTYLHKDD